MQSDTVDLQMSERGGQEMFQKVSISLLALIWIGWQLYSGLTRYNDDQWPFTGYPMYSWVRHVGDPVYMTKLIGHTMSGRSVTVTPEDFNVTYWGLFHQFEVRGYEELVPQLLLLYNQTRADPQERLRRLDIVQEGAVLGIKDHSKPYKKLLFTYEVNQ